MSASGSTATPAATISQSASVSDEPVANTTTIAPKRSLEARDERARGRAREERSRREQEQRRPREPQVELDHGRRRPRAACR